MTDKPISGDDIHCHADDLCQLVGPETLVLTQEDNPSDVNYRPLQENHNRLPYLRLTDGSQPEIISLPMLMALVFLDSRLPASYANLFMVNACILASTFNDAEDCQTLGILADALRVPGHRHPRPGYDPGPGKAPFLTMQQAETPA